MRVTVYSATKVDVVVIGAGQAGLSAAYHLRRRGFAPYQGFVVLDADPAPGGAWAHRSPSLRMATVHGFHDLPDFELPPLDPTAPPARCCRGTSPPMRPGTRCPWSGRPG